MCFGGLAGDRLSIFRPADVALASRIRTPWTRLFSAPFFSYSWVARIDRQAVRVNLLLRHASAARLLGEVLARIPRALDRFEHAARLSPGADPGHFAAESDRREEFRLTGRRPPTSPS